MLSELDEDLEEEMVADEECVTDKEVSLYKSLPRSATSDPLDWWRQHKTTFPYLCKLARKYLCIPATSVASEREFSAAGNIVSAKRNCLKPAKVNQLCFLSQNLKSIQLY